MSAREIKFEFLYKGLPFSSTNTDCNWFKKHYTLDQLIDKSLSQLSDVHHKSELVAKRQFIGRKDCNGVDIYEGDVISIFDFCDCDLMMIGVVKFGVNDCPSFDIYDKKGGTYSDEYNTFTNDNDLYLKVIGNIYQHQHLLGE